MEPVANMAVMNPTNWQIASPNVGVPFNTTSGMKIQMDNASPQGL